ncbi:MAG: response regulator transcription factor [Chloroflexi bacterium]|nr:response regulator transcription factor [Chloroflexota bacterium]
MSRIRVLIADDHAILREGIKVLLQLQPDIEVVGQAADGYEAVQKAQELVPDVILLDIAMPKMGGLEAVLELRKVRPESRVLVLTQYDNKEYIYRFLKAGVAGYILKKAVGSDLVAGIRAVYEGGSYLDTHIAPEVIQGYLRGEPTSTGASDQLTDREKQVLALVAKGHTAKEIADILSVSEKTVLHHRANIMEKLNVHNRADLVKWAVREGLTDMQM